MVGDVAFFSGFHSRRFGKTRGKGRRRTNRIRKKAGRHFAGNGKSQECDIDKQSVRIVLRRTNLPAAGLFRDDRRRFQALGKASGRPRGT